MLRFLCRVILVKLCCHMGDAVASRLVRSSPDRAVGVRALAGDTMLCSWARHLTLGKLLGKPKLTIKFWDKIEGVI